MTNEQLIVRLHREAPFDLEGYGRAFEPDSIVEMNLPICLNGNHRPSRLEKEEAVYIVRRMMNVHLYG
jgi:hypothetical protein